ncbi:laccase [Diaporthe helianthi]|uniref:Laccase n=1 Tax=Diaporthe helianthi TaxID=158607 RepID=A0A2P5HYX3_DIAHE|nr:laccase [Diaporthe helianthi]
MAMSLPSLPASTSNLMPRQSSCQNSATSRGCWGDFSIDTNYYDVFPDTGITRDIWLSVQEGPCGPDGVGTTCQTINGTMPGPLIMADWGDRLNIHVTNNLPVNGTAIHWHGIRQLNSVAADGVPGVTQCPIAPGTSLTYSFHLTQYGTSWYHSHLSLQYGMGVLGPMIINGPATADYDEDLGALMLQDWSHETAFSLWDTAKQGAPPTVENGLINGTNTYNCRSTDACTGTVGRKFETSFEAGKKYRIRLINGATDGHFQFSIDGHSLTVIANDLVPIKPHAADSVLLSMGQRYDIIFEANAMPGDYWLRSDWVDACMSNANPRGITGIVRYDNSSSTATPTTTSAVTTPATCNDEPFTSLVPHVALDIGTVTQTATESLDFKFDTYFKWTLNGSSLLLDWATPTLDRVILGNTTFPTDYNVVSIDGTSSDWATLVIQDSTGFGLFHPIHLHGHDFWVVAQGVGTCDPTTSSITTINPPRRDVATLPGNGYLAIAFKMDKPGPWLLHCHVAWHASGGFALEFVERADEIVGAMPIGDQTAVQNTCQAWGSFDQLVNQDDSGI